MSIKRRLRELEEKHTGPQETPKEVEKRRKQIWAQAAHSNDCREGGGEAPLFEIDERGDVFCTHDGRPVTDFRQILAEKFYWMEVGWGGPGLIHGEEAQALYIPGGQLALSREYVNLERLMGKEREEAWASEDA